MIYECLDVDTGIDRYTANRKSISPDIEIAKIDEHGCNYHDFVLIKYANKKNIFKQVQLLALKYKQSEKTVCIIGCEKEDKECKYSSKKNVVHKKLMPRGK